MGSFQKTKDLKIRLIIHQLFLKDKIEEKNGNIKNRHNSTVFSFANGCLLISKK